MKRTTIAVDVAKTVFEVAVSQKPGRIAAKHRLSRSQFARFLGQQQSATVVLEACGTAHFWGRQAIALGHEVVLLPPHAVRPYVPRNKTDHTDAKGLLEAVRNEGIRPVPVKSVAQQTLGALHRLRSTWIAARTARLNTTRGILRELGYVIPLGATQVAPRVRRLIEDPDSGLPEALRSPLAATLDEIRDLEARIRTTEKQIAALAEQTPVVGRLRTLPGVGLLTATALVAFVGDMQRFPTGRHFASYLGLTPRESSSGLRRRLGAISKRGDSYLRMLLIHGARSFLWHAQRASTPNRLQTWALGVQSKRGHNKAAVALANKLARIVWAVWKKGEVFHTGPAQLTSTEE
jgi:transposase